MPSVAIPLPVLRTAPPLVECIDCARCCTYVGVGINAPTTARLATDVLWYLYHERVQVYADDEGEWSVLFETRCRKLGEDLRCTIYPARPHICRSFDNRSCDVNAPGRRALTFREPSEFLAWLQAERKQLYAKIEARFVLGRSAPKQRARTAHVGRAVARKARI